MLNGESGDITDPVGHPGYCWPQYPEILWDVPDILELLEGMTVVESEVVRRPVETDEGRKFARDTLVRARAPLPESG